MRGPDVKHGGITLLASPEGGRHPPGNALLISGTDRTVLVAPRSRSPDEGGAPSRGSAGARGRTAPATPPGSR
jgi:hypothetical protein